MPLYEIETLQNHVVAKKMIVDADNLEAAQQEGTKEENLQHSELEIGPAISEPKVLEVRPIDEDGNPISEETAQALESASLTSLQTEANQRPRFRILEAADSDDDT